jgi:hypothetical protein
MALIGAVGVFLLGSCVGLLVALYLQGARTNQLAEHAAEQRAEALALAEQQHNERRAQLIAMTAALVDRLQLVGADLAAEVRDANTQQRNDLRLAVGLPRVSTPSEARPSRPAAAWASSPPARSTPATPATSREEGRASLADAADEPTPPSGWTLEQVRAHTETAGEEHPQ